jgi:hypothetical protein
MSLSRMLLLCSVLLATVVALAAPAPATGPAGSSTVAIQTYLQPDLSLKSVFVADSFTGKPAALLGRTCRCSCGFPCKTDADCGPGGVCSGGISCCDKSLQDPAWTNTASSRKHPAPVFAAKCN